MIHAEYPSRPARRRFSKLTPTYPIHVITDSEWFKQLFKIHRELAAGQASFSPYLYWKVSQIMKALSQADHLSAGGYAQNLIQKKHLIGHFYLAQSLKLQNKLTDSDRHLAVFLNRYPKHADGTYLYAEIQAQTGHKENAWSVLEALLARSKRRKTWQALSNLVETPQDFERFLNLFRQKYDYRSKPLSFDLTSHLSNAASRAGDTDFALELWRSQYRFAAETSYNPAPKIQLRGKYTDQLAADALGAVKNCLDAAGIPFFLISGTLLGCIRENKLLGHDKDIDIGVWETHSAEQLKEVFRNSGCFYILPNKSKELAVIRHVNGITIDVFIHHRESDDYWHAGGKSKWHNTPFNLIPKAFLNNRYLIPENYERYLTENYGDWKTPNINFDSALDTPNMEVTNPKDMQIYLYKRIILLKNANPELSKRLSDALRAHGEKI